MMNPATRVQLGQTDGTVLPVLLLAELAIDYEAQTARLRALAKDIKLEAP